MTITLLVIAGFLTLGAVVATWLAVRNDRNMGHPGGKPATIPADYPTFAVSGQKAATH
ncbi:MAG: hypothetical protein LV480_06030 [Methylacidiphilales bacterium]|nr:hypothetical protein [Candidatus Methylacidiphilales bacterium]